MQPYPKALGIGQNSPAFYRDSVLCPLEIQASWRHGFAGTLRVTRINGEATNQRHGEQPKARHPARYELFNLLCPSGALRAHELGMPSIVAGGLLFHHYPMHPDGIVSSI